MTARVGKLLRSAGVALGVTSIYLIFLLGPLVSSTHAVVYHWSGSPSELFLPPLLDFFVFWLVLTVLLVLTQRPGRLHRAVWGAMIFFMPWILLKNWSSLAAKPIIHGLSASLFVVATLALLICVIFWGPVFEKRLEQVENFTSTLLLFLAAGGAMILCQVAWFGWKARSLNAELPLHRASYREREHGEGPRIIWIVFDELSYEQVYERRLAGLQLPAFDALANQAILFTHTKPAGIMTERVLPSLMTGVPVDAIRSSSDGRRLSLHNSVSGEWQKFEEHDTVFEDALKLNYKTAVAGWYNPYCRILPEVLDRCFWILGSPAENTMLPHMGVLSNLPMPLLQFAGGGRAYRFASLFLHFSDSAELGAKLHISDYVALEEAADRVLDDRSSEFSLIHLPVPHPNGIYDRAKDRFATKHSDYLDNLALADKLLGHIRLRLEQSGQWNGSTIVLMGDHSWRTKLLWRDTTEWTDEEQRASHGGQFDDRPVYMVKLADQQVGARFDEPFAAVNTRRLLDGLLSQKIRTADDLSAWAKHAAN
jgi:Sulfatase